MGGVDDRVDGDVARPIGNRRVMAGYARCGIRPAIPGRLMGSPFSGTGKVRSREPRKPASVPDIGADTVFGRERKFGQFVARFKCGYERNPRFPASHQPVEGRLVGRHIDFVVVALLFGGCKRGHVCIGNKSGGEQHGHTRKYRRKNENSFPVFIHRALTFVVEISDKSIHRFCLEKGASTVTGG